MANFSHLEIRYGERGYVGKVNEFINAAEATETMKEELETGTITVGAGLTQTGSKFTENVQISLGTPSTVSGSTSNSVTGVNHTHAVPLSSQAQAEGGTNNATMMTPLRVVQHINTRVATNADMTNGSSDKLVTISGMSYYKQSITVNGTTVSDSLLATSLFTRQYYLSRVTDPSYGNEKILTPYVLGEKIRDVIRAGIGKGVGEVTQYLTNRWATVDIPTTGGTYGGMAENPTNGRMVLVGRTGTRLMTSPDGVTWDVVSDMTGDYKCVIRSQRLNMFIVLSGAGTNRVSTSPSGQIWTNRTTPQYAWNWMVESPQLGLIVAVAESSAGGRVMVSRDAVNWETHQSSTTATLRGITWSPSLGIFLAVGDRAIIMSEDGKNWTSVTSPNVSWSKVEWSPSLGIFVASSDSGSVSFGISSDGINWQTVSVNKNAATWSSLTWSGELGLFLAHANSGADRGLYVSKDGRKWVLKRRTISATNAMMYSSYYGRFYATVEGAVLAYAPK